MQRGCSWFVFEVAVVGVVEDVSLLLLVMSSVLMLSCILMSCTAVEVGVVGNSGAVVRLLMLRPFVRYCHLPCCPVAVFTMQPPPLLYSRRSCNTTAFDVAQLLLHCAPYLQCSRWATHRRNQVTTRLSPYHAHSNKSRTLARSLRNKWFLNSASKDAWQQNTNN